MRLELGLALAAALVAPLMVWTRPAQALGGQWCWALGTLCALVGMLTGWRVRSASTRPATQLLALVAVLVGGSVSAALLGSAAYLTLRSFFSAGPDLGL